jgi:selenide,water dikinase
VQTVDFFPPIVDDPYHFGAIAVANAASDIYAMGANPILGLNIVAFPRDLPFSVLTSILQGAYDKAQEAGILIVGGHTIDDKEPKYGMAVTGLVRPGEQVAAAGSRPGDALVLTKPLGTGIITTASKNGVLEAHFLANAISVMGTLNEMASASMTHVGVNACTDVTGFGLTGHLKAMMAASNTAARLFWSNIQLLPGVLDLAKQGIAPDGTRRNLDSLGPLVTWDSSLSDDVRIILSDAQTSGGLLISVPQQKASALMGELENHGVHDAKIIGEVINGIAGAIDVVP